MTKKITITLEESYIDELSEFAKDMGKKKAQIIREALQDYFDANAICNAGGSTAKRARERHRQSTTDYCGRNG